MTKIKQMTKEKLLKGERTMINASLSTRNDLKEAAARLKVPMYRLLAALAAYALTLEDVTQLENHQTQEP